MKKYTLPKLSPQEMAAMLNNAVDGVTPEKLIAELGAPHHWSDDQMRWGSQGSLSVELDRGVATVWYSHEKNRGGADFSALFRDKDQYVANRVDPNGKEKPSKATKGWTTEETIDKFWTNAKSIDGSDNVEPYLKSRGLFPHLPSDLARKVMHQSAPGNGKFPALIVPVTNIEGVVTGIQAIRCPGGKKLDHAAKISGGRIKGGAWQLPGNGRTVVLVEGPEDALSIWQNCNVRTMAVMGKWNFQYAPVSPSDDVVVCFDRDDNLSEDDAQQMVGWLDALSQRCRSVRFVEPPEGYKDANEMLLDGRDLKAELVEQAVLYGNTEPVLTNKGLLETPLESIEPRQWLHGYHLIKGFISGIVAPGGMSKSTLVSTEMLEIASGIDITGQRMFEKVSVLYINGEDPLDEIHRQLRGRMEQYGITAADLEGRFDFFSGRDLDLQLVITEDREVKENANAINTLRNMIEAQGAEVVCLDPLSSFHGINENSNEEMNKLMKVVRRLADELKISFQLVHHSTKEAQRANSGGAEQARGASAFVDACRVVRVIRRLTKDEESAYMVEEGEYVRAHIAKGNLSKNRGGVTYHTLGVNLGNANEVYTEGDSIAYIEVHTGSANALSEWVDDPGRMVAVAEVLHVLPDENRLWKHGRCPNDWLGHPIAEKFNLDPKEDKAKINSILERLEEIGALEQVTRQDTRQGREVTIYRTNRDTVKSLLKHRKSG